jgi:tRNA-splicing ligase RtcB (3'-phosphate/5'-hydroxy nucleic acid ligase)
MATDAFICVAGERAGDAFFSANHGAGRVLDKPEARRAFSDDDVRAELEARSILLFRGGPGSLEEQAPGAFKDVDAVIDSMRATRLAAPVARTRPLAVLKG